MPEYKLETRYIKDKSNDRLDPARTPLSRKASAYEMA